MQIRRLRHVLLYAASKERFHAQAMPWTGARLFVGVEEELVASRIDVGRVALEEAQRMGSAVAGVSIHTIYGNKKRWSVGFSSLKL